MSDTPHKVILALASLVWLGIVLNLVLPFPAPWNVVLRWFGLGLFVVHGLELMMFRNLLGASGNQKGVDALLIVIAGAFHASWLARIRASRAKADA